MSATPGSTVTSAITDADVKGQLLAVAGTGIGVGAVILVVRKGWSLVSGFIR